MDGAFDEELRADVLLAGRYRLRRRLGRGGMSVVWQAYDRVLERQVAVKVLAGELAGQPDVRRRVRAEARATAKLMHPHVVHVFDYAEQARPDGTVLPFVVMELVSGEPLERRLAAGPLAWPLAVRLAGQVADALATAHEAGVVHRDVTAGNVLLTDSGVKMVDFGISAAIGDRETDQGDGRILGTPAYLAPERLAGLPVAASADVYSLGVLLHVMLAGRTPFDGDTTTEVTRSHWYRPPAPLPDIDGLPVEVDLLRRRCLAKRAGQRPTAAQVVAALAEIPLPADGAESAPSYGAEPPPPEAVATGEAGVATVPVAWGTAVPADARPARGRRVALVAAGAAAVLAGAAVLLAATAGGDPAPRPHAGGTGSATAAPAGSAASAGRSGTPSASASPSPSAGPSSRSPSPSASPTRASAAPTPSAGRSEAAAARPAACRVRWSVDSDWGSGFTARITVDARRRPARWTLTFAFPGNQRIRTGWNGTFRQDGNAVTVTSPGWRSSSAIVLGLSADYSGQNRPPEGYALNGTACTTE